MDWEQKLDALNKLEPCSLIMRAPGAWSVHQATEVKRFAKIHPIVGIGRTPEAAVEAHWTALTDIGDRDIVVVRGGRASRMAVRWNGFMWSPVDENAKVLA